MDCSIKTWDLPTGQLIDCFTLEAPPTSVSLSDSGEYLACSVADELGMYIWYVELKVAQYLPCLCYCLSSQAQHISISTSKHSSSGRGC